MNRFDVVSLTLAEISLALLFAFIAIFVPAYARATNDAHAAKTYSQIQKELAQANAENAQLHQELDDSRRNLRSDVAPSCHEIGKATNWLFVATIRGSDDYEVLGQDYTLDALRAKYASALTQARQDRCVRRVRIYCGEGVSGVDYNSALRHIDIYFYTQLLGAERSTVVR